jgi:hypothetical protein
MTASPISAAAEPITLHISTLCECYYCDDCGCGFASDDAICPECNTEGDPADYCDGDCSEFAREMFAELWDARFAGKPFTFEASGVGWTRKSQSGLMEDGLSGTQALERLLGDEGTVKASFAPNACTAVRYSHDEPTGATYTFTGLTGPQHQLFTAIVGDDNNVDMDAVFQAAQAVL